MIIWILVIILIAFISELITYKIIKKIDKAERKKLYNWELDYVKELQRQNVILKKQKEKEQTKNGDNNTASDTVDNSSTNVLEFNTSGENNMQATQ